MIKTFIILNRWLLLTVVILIFLSSLLQNQGKQKIQSGDYKNITSYFSTLTKDKHHLSAEQIFSGNFDHLFSAKQGINPFGDSNKTYWFKASLPSELFSQNTSLIEIPYRYLKEIDVWVKDNSSSKITHGRSGIDNSLNRNAETTETNIFMLPKTNAGIEVVIAINTNSLVNVPVLLWQEKSWQQNNTLEEFWYGIFVGGTIILLLYNLFLSIALRDTSYLYYVFYLFFLTLLIIRTAGIADAEILSTLPIIGGRSHALVTLIVVSEILFINRFLDVRKNIPLAWKFSVGLMLLLIPPAIPDLLGIQAQGEWNTLLTSIMLTIPAGTLFYYIAVSVISFRRGIKQVRFTFLAFSIFYASFFAYLLYILGIIGYSSTIKHGMEIGSLIEGLILSLALADRINLLSHEKKIIEQQTLQLNQKFTKGFIDAQELEREALSKRLNISVNQNLSQLKNNLDQIIENCESNAAASNMTDKLNQQITTCSEILSQVRNMSHHLHPHILQRLGLAKAIDSTLESILQSANIEWQSDIPELPENFAKENTITIFRVIQEYIIQFILLSIPQEVILSLEVSQDQVLVRIKDDGIVRQDDTCAQSSSVLNHLEGRIALFGGAFSFHSTETSGNQLSFSIPIESIAKN